MKIHVNIFLVLIFFSAHSNAFDKQKIVYQNGTDKEKTVTFEFYGAKFEPALDILSKTEIKQPEIRKVSDFLKKFYEANKNGTKQEILLQWNLGERSILDKDITNVMYEGNRARFNQITTMQLKMIIEYGKYYICYVNFDFGSAKKVFKYTLVRRKGALYLTNKLNGDYFYDAISHYLDKQNFEGVNTQL